MTLVHLKGFLYPPPSRPVGAGDAIAFPDFDRSVNPISTRGDRLIAQHITTRPHPRIFRPSYGPAFHHHHFMHWVELSCSAESAQCQVNIWKGSFFHHFYSRALAMAACSILCCWLSRWRYWLYFSPFFHWTQTSKVTKIQYGWKYKTLSDWYTFSWSHIPDPRIKQRYLLELTKNNQRRFGANLQALMSNIRITIRCYEQFLCQNINQSYVNKICKWRVFMLPLAWS